MNGLTQVVEAVMVSARAVPDETRPAVTARATMAAPDSRLLVLILIIPGVPFDPVVVETVSTKRTRRARRLGITVAPSTVWQILKDAGINPAPRLFLASDDSSYVNGMELVADGGITAS